MQISALSLSVWEQIPGHVWRDTQHRGDVVGCHRHGRMRWALDHIEICAVLPSTTNTYSTNSSAPQGTTGTPAARPCAGSQDAGAGAAGSLGRGRWRRFVLRISGRCRGRCRRKRSRDGRRAGRRRSGRRDPVCRSGGPEARAGWDTTPTRPWISSGRPSRIVRGMPVSDVNHGYPPSSPTAVACRTASAREETPSFR